MTKHISQLAVLSASPEGRPHYLKKVFDSFLNIMLSKSPTFHIQRSHIYEHERQDYLPIHSQHQQPNHKHNNKNDNFITKLTSNFKHKHIGSDSNMFRSEIIFNPRLDLSQKKHSTSTVNNNNNNNINRCSMSPTNSCFSVASIGNPIEDCQQKVYDDVDDHGDDDDGGDYDNDDDDVNVAGDDPDADDVNDYTDEDYSQKDDVDELFFIIPSTKSISPPQNIPSVSQLKQTNTCTLNTVNNNNNKNLVNDSPNIQKSSSTRLPNLKERITHTQNIWCLPNVSRSESEKLLKFAEIGNFIVRVNQHNSSMVLTRVCPPTSGLRTSNKIRERFNGCSRGVSSNSHNIDDIDIKKFPLPIKHNLIEILPHDGYCLTGDKKMRLIFKSLVHLIEFYLRVEIKSYGSFLCLPMVIAQAKTIDELEQYNKQGMEFWKSINNHWNIEQFKGLNSQHYQSKKLSLKNQFSNNNNSNTSMKTSILWNQKDGAGVKSPPASAVVESSTSSSTSGAPSTQHQHQQHEEYPRWRQMMMLNPDTNGGGKSMPRVRQRASSLNDRLTTQKHSDYNKLKQHENNIENIEKYSFSGKNNQKLNHTSTLLESMKQRLDHRNHMNNTHYHHNNNNSSSSRSQLNLDKQSMTATITGAGANLTKIKTNDPPDSSSSSQPSHRIHQSRSHQNGVYEGAESEFWDILLQAKSSNPVQTNNGSHAGWRSWNTNQSIKPSINQAHTQPNEITITTTTLTTNTTLSTMTATNTNTNTNTTNLSNNRLQQRKASTPPHYIHTTISNPFNLTNSASSKYHQDIGDFIFPHEVVNSQEKKRQLKHQISLPSEKLQPTIDALNKSLANQMLPIITTTTTTQSATTAATPTSTTQSLHVNTGDNIITSNSHNCITSNTSGFSADTTHKNINSSISRDTGSNKKLPDYFTRIIDTSNGKNSNSNNNNNEDDGDNDVISSNLVSNPIYLDESFIINDQLTVDTKFSHDDESGANYQNNEITQCYMDKTSSDYDIIIDKSDDYNQTRRSLKLNELKNDIITPQTVGHVFVMKAKAYPIEDYSFLSNLPDCSDVGVVVDKSIRKTTPPPPPLPASSSSTGVGTKSPTTPSSTNCHQEADKIKTLATTTTATDITHTTNTTTTDNNISSIFESSNTMNKPKLRRAYTSKKSSKRLQPYMELLSDDNSTTTTNSRRHGLLFLGESSTWLRNNILPTEEIDKIFSTNAIKQANSTNSTGNIHGTQTTQIKNSPTLANNIIHTDRSHLRRHLQHSNSDSSDINEPFLDQYNYKKHDFKSSDYQADKRSCCFKNDHNSKVNYSTTTTTETTALLETPIDSLPAEGPTVTLLSAPRTPHYSDSDYQSEQDIAWTRTLHSQQSYPPTRQSVLLDPQQTKGGKLESNSSSPAASSRASTVFCPPWDSAPIGPYLADLLKLNPPFSNLDENNQSSSGEQHHIRTDHPCQHQKQQACQQHRRESSTFNRRKTFSSVEHQLWAEKLAADYNNYCSSSCSITSTPPTTGDVSNNINNNNSNKLDIHNLFWLWQEQQQQQRQSQSNDEKSSSASMGNIDLLKKLQNDFNTAMNTSHNEGGEKPPPLPARSKRSVPIGMNHINNSNSNNNNIDNPLNLSNISKKNSSDFKGCSLEDFTDDISPYAVTACHSSSMCNEDNHKNNIDSMISIPESTGDPYSLNSLKQYTPATPLNSTHHDNGNGTVTPATATTTTTTTKAWTKTTATNTGITANNNNDSTTVEELLPYDYSASNRSTLFDFSQTSLNNNSNPSECTKMNNNNNSGNDNRGDKKWPDNYVYAQVLPKHLRDNNDKNQYADSTSLDLYSTMNTFQPDSFNTLDNCELLNLKPLENLSLNKPTDCIESFISKQCIAPLTSGEEELEGEEEGEEALQSSPSTNSLASACSSTNASSSSSSSTSPSALSSSTTFDSKTSISSWNSSEMYSSPIISKSFLVGQQNPVSVTKRNRSIQSISANHRSGVDNHHHHHQQHHQPSEQQPSRQYGKSSEQRSSTDIMNECNELPKKTKKIGRHIRKFFHKLMITGSNNHIAEQINLFVECTKAGSERGPYRTMQSIRQFINGMTNYLLKNPELGLPKAVEREKKELNQFGYVNVGFHLESALQRFILKPLHSHVIKLLKQEQVKNTDFTNLLIKVQMLCDPQTHSSDLGIQASVAPPKESLIQYVTSAYSRLENTYSVNRKMNYLVCIFNSIRKNIYNVKSDQEVDANSLNTEDLYAYYAWVFARSGLLLTPLISNASEPNPHGNTSTPPLDQPSASKSIFLDLSICTTS
ncbi:unnamed protein product [Trichobilharzia szidati]|nr:unnamed protein product [Trichobilharzia szidati]